MIEGTLPPNDIEAEKSILGACLLDNKVIPIALLHLKPQSFHQPRHAIIFEAIAEMNNSNEPVDFITLKERLRKESKLDQCGGVSYIASLTDNVTSVANIEKHALIVAECFIKRELITMCSETIKMCYSGLDDVFEIINDVRLKLGAVTTFGSSNMELIGDILKDNIQEMEAIQRGDKPPGVMVGLAEVDRVFRGFQKGELIIIAARPGMGKTALALTMAKNAAVQKTPVAVFSFEMNKRQFGQRVFSMDGDVKINKQKSGQLSPSDWQTINVVSDENSRTMLYVDDKSSYNIDQLRAVAINSVKELGIGMIVVDYIQLMNPTGKNNQNRERDVSDISRGLKLLAKDLDIPVIALSQLSRAVETRGGSKRPLLSDLRESGSIEQDADVVIFITRPEYYGVTELDNGTSAYQYAEIIIAKHRNGAIVDIPVRFLEKQVKFVDWNNGVEYNYTDSPYGNVF